MGRGRAKAKQTKVARDLKYRTHETDFGQLAKELHGEKDSSPDLDTGLDTGLDGGLEADDYDEWSDYSPSRQD